MSLTTQIEFTSFGKIPRMFRDMVITEKIDGTNAAVGFTECQDFAEMPNATPIAPGDGKIYAAYAQSRKRLITPMKDNYGFAKWVWDNAKDLFLILGPGLHFGEWWGQDIQRGYGLTEKKFSLFNTKRWSWLNDVNLLHGAITGDGRIVPPGLGSVPVLYEGMFNTTSVSNTLALLAISGSVAAPGFMDPEGIVVYHTAANMTFKVTVKNDEKPKALVEAEKPAEIVGSGGIVLPGLSAG